MDTDAEVSVIKLYNPPTECGNDRCDDGLLEFIYCVVIPIGVMLLLLLILAVIMCCSSKSCKCKKYSALNTQSNDIQLENYNSIRRASASLRQMSHNRETPLMGSRAGSMTLDRSHRRPHRARDSCHSAPGTLQRQYRNRHSEQRTSGPPPPYMMNNEEGFLVQPRRPLHSDVDAPGPPPPPAYSMHSDDVFLGPEFLQSDMQASVRYDDSPDRNGSGAQPLLHPHGHQRR